MIKIAICDDEEILLKSIVQIVKNEFDKYDLEFEISSFLDGTMLLEEHMKNNFDVLFLDIDMPQISGFDIAKSLRDEFHKSYIIFITSHQQLVFESMDFQPFNFIRKNSNISMEQNFSMVIQKLINNIKQNEDVVLQVDDSENIMVSIKDIVLLESNKNYVNYYINNERNTVKVRCTLKECEEKFSKYNFVKIHRSYILNFRYLSKFDKANDEIDISFLNKRILISKNLRKSVEEKYTLYLRETR